MIGGDLLFFCAPRACDSIGGKQVVCPLSRMRVRVRAHINFRAI